jgi:isoleucyl-tRNA synthetase
VRNVARRAPLRNRSIALSQLASLWSADRARFVGIQREQFKRLGVFADWDRPYLTLDKEYEADELRLFADIVEKGFVYRGKKPVYWSTGALTALAEAEVEYQDRISPAIYVKFPAITGKLAELGAKVVIWTTTPWTLPANLAVAYNSTFQYVQVNVGEENYILFRGLLPAVAEKCGWSGYEEKPFETAELAKLRYFSGLSIEEAAAAIGIPRSTAYVQWSFARAALRVLRETDTGEHTS